MKTRTWLILLIALNCYSAFSQIGINTDQPEPDALIDIKSLSTKGLLLPRVALTTITNPNPMTAHVSGLVVFNTTASGELTPGLYYNNGTSWIRMTTNKTRIGDIKHGFQSADHSGWYILDGRALSAITSTVARNNAQNIGITSNLPNAQDRFLKTQQGTETIMASGGTNSIILTQGNLPNVTFSGTTNIAGDHNHTYIDSSTGTTTGGSGTNNPVANAGSNNYQTGTSGNHTHNISVNSGGTSAPISYTPPSIAANVFIYLGN